MGASDKYQLIVESVSRGDAELRRLEQVINKLADTTEKSQKRSADSYTRTSKQASDAASSQEASVKRIMDSVESGSHRIRNGVLAISAGVIATKQVFDGLSGSVDKFTAATLRSDAALSRTLATYRLTRLASSAAFGARALLGTAGTIGAGLAVEAVIRNARAQAEKVQAASLSAATTGNSFGGAYALTRAASLTGRDLGFLGGRSPEDVAGLNARLSGIADPIERARVAVNLFGKDAAAALTGIDDRLARQVKRAEELGAALDGPTREGLQAMSDFFHNFHPFDDLSDGLKNFLEEGKINLAKFAVDVARATRQAARDSAGFVNVQGPDFELSGDNQAFMPKSENRFRGGLSSAEQFILDSRKTLVGQLANRDTGGFAVRSLGSASLLGSAKSSIAAFQNSPQGLQQGLSEVESRLARSRKLFADSTDEQRALLSEQIIQDTKAVSAIQARIKGLETEKSIREQIARLADRLAVADANPFFSLLVEQQRSFSDNKAAGASSAQLGRVDSAFGALRGNALKKLSTDATAGVTFDTARTAETPLQEQSRLFQFGKKLPPFQTEIPGSDAVLERGFAAIEKFRARALDLSKQELEFQTRRLVLLSGPGGELAAIQSATQLRLDGLEKQKQLGVEAFEIDKQRVQILRDADIQRLEFAKKQRDAGREGTGRVFDALISGGSGGVGALIKSVGLSQVRTIAQNAGEKLTTSAGGFLGKIGAASGFGKFLGGTAFDPQNAGDPLKTATDANTAATNANTAALMIRGGGAGITGGFSGIAAGLSGLLRSTPTAFSAPPSITYGSSTSTIAGSSEPGFDAMNATGSFGRDMSQVSSVPGTQKLNANQNFSVQGGKSDVGRAVAYAGAATTAAFGAFNGFKAGGVQGNLSGAASVLGGIALIPGPQQPFVAAAALSLAVIAALIGDPKKNRDKAIDRLVTDARFTETQPLDYAFDTRGGGFDYNSRGGLRSMPINLTINALDSRSILDRGEDIASAVRDAMYAGHSINQAAQEVVLGV